MDEGDRWRLFGELFEGERDDGARRGSLIHHREAEALDVVCVDGSFVAGCEDGDYSSERVFGCRGEKGKQVTAKYQHESKRARENKGEVLTLRTDCENM